MFIKSVFSLIPFWLLFSSQMNNSPKLVIVAYREPETMFGEIKQVIETRLNVHAEPALCRVDTTFFDKNTNPVEARLGDNGHNCITIYYVVNYDKTGKKAEKIIYSSIRTDTFETDKFGHLTKSHDAQGFISYTINNTHIEASVLYRRPDSVLLKQQYKYSSNGLLSEFDFYTNKDVLKGTCSYTYLSIDHYGNWTKRVLHYKENFGGTVADTIIRKITYY
jgi:hypothetical protein